MFTNAKEYIDQLTAKGEISFTTQSLQTALGITAKAAERAIARLRHKKEITSPAKGYYLILTPEFRKLGCLPPDYFIDDLMQYWQQKYYVALLSAALYYGAAHQQPQVFQVMTDHFHRPITCGRVKIEFITQKNLTDATTQLKTHTGTMNISTPEATMLDLIHFMRRSGSINHIATVLDELAESITPTHLYTLLERNRDLTAAQRLGFLLECLDKKKLAATIYEYLATKNNHIVPLVPYYPITGVKRNTKWRVAINASIGSDIHGSH